MSKEVIAVDIDDVLFPCSYRLVDAYGEQLGIEFDYPAIMAGGELKGTFAVMKGATELEDDEIIDQVESILSSPAFHNIEPIEGSINGLHHLAERHKIIAVSSRPAVIKAETVTWITDHYPGVFQSIHVLGGRWGQGATTDKLETYSEAGVRFVIDDLYRHAERAAHIGAEALLFGNYPWNHIGELPSHVTRCEDWVAVTDYFDARS